MNDNTKYYDNCQVYPGQYVPLMNEAEIRKEIKHSFGTGAILPPICITELATSYMLELHIPGLNREDFLIHANNNALSVCVLHKGCNQRTTNNMSNHDFNFGFCNRHIKLPNNADAAFISAEYTAGTLRFQVPKTKQPVKHFHSSIVVY